MYSVGSLSMASSPTTEKVIPYTLLGMTAVTGLVDAVSFLSLGAVFTANMTGNIVLLAFASAHVSGLSIARSLTALLAFLVGAILGGRAMARANPDSQIRFAAQAFQLEMAFLLAASLCGIGYRGDLLEDSFQPFALIALTALAMGTRNAAVRKLAIPDLTTTVLTLTITGIAPDYSIANGTNRSERFRYYFAMGKIRVTLRNISVHRATTKYFLARLFSKTRLKRKDFQAIARLAWAQEVSGSNPDAPTICLLIFNARVFDR